MSLTNSSYAPSDDYYSGTRDGLLKLFPNQIESVLDIGCGAGSYLRICQQRGAQDICGLELRADVAQVLRAQPWVSEVLVGSVEEVDLRPYAGRFKLLIASFVLEHVSNPWQVLSALKRCLHPEGLMVGSLPNVRYAPVSFGLLFGGRWTYAEHGVMDWTHLRFYTRKTVLDLLHDCGLDVVSITPEFGAKAAIVNRLTMGIFEPFLAYGYNFLARRRPDADHAVDVIRPTNLDH